jgi:aminoglycoside phosphotransferase (APT) family kinase protein
MRSGTIDVSRTVGRDAIDLVVLRDRVSETARSAGLGRLESLSPIQAGASSMNFLGQIAGETGSVTKIVVKVAPPGLEPVRNRDVLRQAKLLTSLSAVPGLAVPDILATDGGSPPEVPPLFIMSHVDGEGIEPIFERDGPLPSADEVRQRAIAASRMLGVLHVVDVESIGLGRERQVDALAELERWIKGFATVEPELREGADEVAEMLRAAIPKPMASAILHGDYRLGNLLCRDERVVAIIDWELWGLGDPRTDFAWFLLHRDPAGNPHGDREAPGMPAAEELLETYEASLGQSVGDLRWFSALVRFKQAAAGALLVKHNRNSPNPDPRRELSAALIAPQLADAASLL